MLFSSTKTCFLILPFILLWLSACASELPVLQPEQEISVVGIAEPKLDNLDIRIDWVSISNDVGDLLGNGELYLELLVIRQNGDSRSLRAPGLESYSIRGNERIPLDGFSLTINEIEINEKVLVYFLAFESDELDFLSDRAASTAIDSAIVTLEHGLETGAILGKTLSHANIFSLILTTVTGGAYEWWQEADTLGGYAVLLEQDNNWLSGQTYRGKSDDGNLTLQFSIIPDLQSNTVELITSEPNVNTIDQSPPPTSTMPKPTATLSPTPKETPVTKPTATNFSPISQLILVNTETNQDIAFLSDQYALTLSNLSTSKLDIRANVSTSWVESIIFYLDGTQFELNGRNLENSPPYSMAGDINGDYYNNWDWNGMIGVHTISAIACSQDHGQGTCSSPYTITIRVSP